MAAPSPVPPGGAGGAGGPGDWQHWLTAVGAAVGGGGALAAAARLLDKLVPSGDRRLQDEAERRKDVRERIETLETQLSAIREECAKREAALRDESDEREHALRDELAAKTAAWLDAERRILEVERRMVQAGVAAEMVRQNIGHPGADLVPRAEVPAPPETGA